MLGDLGRDLKADSGRVELVATRSKNLRRIRPQINLKGLPLTDNDYVGPESDIRFTNFKYDLVYSPTKRIGDKLSDKPYTFCSDIMIGDYGRGWRFKDIEDLKSRGSEIPFLFFLLYWTNLNEELLEFAKTMQGTAIPICVDFIGYEKYLKEQVKAKTGVYPDYSMFYRPKVAKQLKRCQDKYNKEYRRLMGGNK